MWGENDNLIKIKLDAACKKFLSYLFGLFKTFAPFIEYWADVPVWYVMGW